MTVIFANITADPLRLDKRPEFADAVQTSLNCQISEPCNVDAPELLLSAQYVTGFNYAYIPMWGKYYFVGDGTVIDGNRATLPLSVDVLTTNADEIKGLTVRLRRYEKRLTPDMPDNQIHKTARTETENLYFNGGSTPFTIGEGALTTQFHWALSVVGGDGGTQT